MIHTLTLNPALDLLLFIDQFERRSTVRVKKSELSMGGKGSHISANLALLNQRSLAFGICHGEAGRTFMAMLEEYGVKLRFVHRDGGAQTRTNYLLVESTGDSTVVAEKGVQLTEGDLDELFDLMEADICEGDVLALSGDASNAPADTFARIMDRLSHKKPRVFLDTSGAALKRCVCASPFMIKPNAEELSELTGYPVAVDDHSLIQAITSLDEYGIPVVSVTLGEDGSITSTPEGYFRARPPKVNVANTTGCGDAFLTGMITELSRGSGMERAIRFATAVSAAMAESVYPVGFDVERAEQLLPLVQVTRL